MMPPMTDAGGSCVRCASLGRMLRCRIHLREALPTVTVSSCYPDSTCAEPERGIATMVTPWAANEPREDCLHVQPSVTGNPEIDAVPCRAWSRQSPCPALAHQWQHSHPAYLLKPVICLSLPLRWLVREGNPLCHRPCAERPHRLRRRYAGISPALEIFMLCDPLNNRVWQSRSNRDRRRSAPHQTVVR